MAAKIITVAGKGGVGKTSISAAIVRQLMQHAPDAKILAIDADPAVGLATALNVVPKMTVDDIRKQIVTARESDRANMKAAEILGEVRFELLDAITEENGFAFLAVGRPETAGCYCAVNAFLKEVISALSADFDYVVIDGEAGIEQINRRVMEKVTHLILVSDTSKKGMQVIKTIKNVADELMMYEKTGIIVNRLNEESFKQFLDTGGIPVLAYIADDRSLSIADLQGKSVLELEDDSNLVKGVDAALHSLEMIE